MKPELKARAILLRQEGQSVKTIARILGVAQSTSSLWVRGIQSPLQTRVPGKATESQLAGLERGRQGASQRAKKRHDIAFQCGKSSIMTLQDAMCVGLYWGEGSKHNHHWCFTNSDKVAVLEMVHWCRRMGIADSELRLSVQVHPGEFLIPEVQAYWSEVGISAIDIKVYVGRSSSSQRKVSGRMSCGVAALRVQSSTYWFYFIQGQQAQLLGQ